MKKLLFISLLCVVAGTASAQTAFTIGAKAGANFARNLDKYHGNGKFKPAFHVGLFGNVRFADKLAFQPELLYAVQGNKISYEEEDRDNQREVTNYLQVPLLLQYSLNDKLTIEAGPQIGVLLNARLKWDEYWDEDEWEPESADIKEYYKTVDVGISAGIAYKISQRVGLYARFTQGLTNTFINDSEKIRNQVIAVGLSFSF